MNGTGSSNALATSSDGVSIELATVETLGTGNIALNGTDSVNDFNTGVNLTFDSVIQSAGTLTITGAGTGSFSEAVNVADVTLSSVGNLAITATSDDINLGGNTITQSTGTGNVTVTGPVFIGSNNSVSANSGNFTFSSTIDGAGSLTAASASGAVTFTGAVGSATPVGNLTVGAGTTYSNGYSFGSTVAVSNTFSIAPGDPTQSIGVFGDTGTFQVTKADMDALETLTGAVNIAVGDSADSGLMRVAGANLTGASYGLALASGSGNIQFDGSVSASPAAITLASGKNFSATTASGNIVDNAAAGITTSGTGTITLTSGGNIDFANGTTLTSATGDVVLSAATDIVTNGNITTSSGNVTLDSDTAGAGGTGECDG